MGTSWSQPTRIARRSCYSRDVEAIRLMLRVEGPARYCEASEVLQERRRRARTGPMREAYHAFWQAASVWMRLCGTFFFPRLFFQIVTKDLKAAPKRLGPKALLGTEGAYCGTSIGGALMSFPPSPSAGMS